MLRCSNDVWQEVNNQMALWANNGKVQFLVQLLPTLQQGRSGADRKQCGKKKSLIRSTKGT